MVDYHSRSTTASQFASQHLLLPLPLSTEVITALEAPRSLVQELDMLAGERHASLPAFQAGAGLLQLHRVRARVQQMHAELQPRTLAVHHQLPLYVVSQHMIAPAELLVVAPHLEACVPVMNPVRSVLCACRMLCMCLRLWRS